MLTLFRERIVWRHPQWWVLAAAAAAWAMLVVSALGSPGGGHHANTAPIHAGGDSWAVFRGVSHWMLMVVAMMFPFTAGALQATAARSLWRRRHRAMMSWLVGYTMPWLLLGLVATWLTALAGAVSVSALWITTGFALAALWQTAGMRARTLNASHRTWPLAPSGWPATRDCLRAGGVTSAHCVAACAPLMLACSLLGHGAVGLAAMLGATAVAAVERYSVRPDPRWLGAGVALPALLALVV